MRTVLASLAVITVAAFGPASAAAGLSTPASDATDSTASAKVITDWNAIAQRTIFTEAATPVPSSSLYEGFVSVAVYDAVVTIKGRYRPYVPQPRPHGKASAEAAVATAAYDVLRYYFPASTNALTADYVASIAAIDPGPVRDRGVGVGTIAAATIVRLRANDGRNADITLNVTPAPGVWRPTPPAFLPMLVPWLGFVTPLLVHGPKQFAPPGPYPITSARYARDFREVKHYGALMGSRRTPEQTQTALFWSDNAIAQYQAAMRDQVVRRGLDIVDSARMFAIVGATTADTMITCWRAKYDNAYWRPITAIQEADTDGNRRTHADAAWSPLIPTPPYPDYASGHACVTGAASNGLSYLFGGRRIDLQVSSAVTGTTRHFATARALDRETMNARIWLGLHFRKAMTDANRLGHEVSSYGVRHYFRPTR